MTRKALLPFYIVLFCSIYVANASTVDDLRAKIEERNQSIAVLEKEIAEYQDELENIGKEANTLKNAIRIISLEQKKLSADINVTEQKIASASFTITRLSEGIADKSERIDRNLDALSGSVRTIDKLENTSLIEVMLSRDTLSEIWDRIDAQRRFESQIKNDVDIIRELKQSLEEEKISTESKKRELAALRSRLTDQKQILDQNKNEKSSLLNSTKNKESEYKKLLEGRVAMRNAFEQELLQFESELKFAIDPTRFPSVGTKVLSWPLDSVKITQYFGNTSFAKSGAYNGNGHNGIDFRASIGTPVRAALSGVVIGAGNTDNVCPGASYGKWVLIEHANGLSTLYAHFSLIKINTGQTVNTGEILGYSGDTGYATGPHLHFTVYASQGVKILQRKSSVCKGTYTMPVADLKAYLNPISYL